MRSLIAETNVLAFFIDCSAKGRFALAFTL
jgi:hypothetical protein